MTSFVIKPYAQNDKLWAGQFLIQEWGTLRMVSRGKIFFPLEHRGFVAFVDEQAQGFVSYMIEDDQCEVGLLHSIATGQGIGAALIEHVKQAAIEAGCKRLWLITTNDNIHAIRWYQKRGFTIAAIYINALAESRKLKPEIPLLGADNIPLRDEIEFEIVLA